MIKIFLRILFFGLYVAIGYYILYIETERYESQSTVLLKDISKKQTMNLSEMILGENSAIVQDSRVLELYMRSHEMYEHLDRLFELKRYYTGTILDFAQRLYPDSDVWFLKANGKNLLQRYNKDLNILYDDISGTITVSFVHADANIAYKIVKEMIRRSEEVINGFAKENAKIALDFIKKLRREKHQAFIESIRKLIAYQNRHRTIDPSLDVERKITILSNLEAELVKAEVEYATKTKTYNPKSREMMMLKENIRNIKRSIGRVKSELSGGKALELNANVFEYELLKSEMEFAKEVYRQTLINQEEVKIEVAQKSKHLITIIPPVIADDYAYPEKGWDLFLWALVLFAIYGILVAIITIVQNHKD